MGMWIGWDKGWLEGRGRRGEREERGEGEERRGIEDKGVQRRWEWE